MFLVNIIFPSLDHTFQLYWNQYNLFYLFWLSKRKQKGHMLFHIEALEQAGVSLFSWWHSSCNDSLEIVLSTKVRVNTMWRKPHLACNKNACAVFLFWSLTVGRKNGMDCPKWYSTLISEINIGTNAKPDETSNKGTQYTCHELIVLPWMDKVRTRKWHSPQGQNTLEF